MTDSKIVKAWINIFYYLFNLKRFKNQDLISKTSIMIINKLELFNKLGMLIQIVEGLNPGC